MKPVSVRGVRLDRLTNTPVLTMREDDTPRRQFEIFIGAPEAAAISFALEGGKTPRPLTHDLFVLALERLSVAFVRVVLTHVTEGTYFAELVLIKDGAGAAGEEIVISCRPSDAVALALRAHCPIYALDDLLDAVAETVSEDSEEEILDEFRDFIENISPEDFGA